jgi:hypothetical protein
MFRIFGLWLGDVYRLHSIQAPCWMISVLELARPKEEA